MNAAKSFDISKELVWHAYERIKANKGSAGVDEQSLLEFDKDLKNNLYRIWNRMVSGSYFPPPVLAVEIPKKSGGKRVLGIPTVSDRIAQMVVKLRLEPKLEPHFHEDSYGYRPWKSAHQALEVTRRRCWQYDWVLEFDIRGLFDNIDVVKRDQGTPQGGVVSPLLANLFLHYAFDKWMSSCFPGLPFCRYADDGLIHCRSFEQAQAMKQFIEQRFKECKLEVHPDKTKIIYCKDKNRRGEYEHIQFDFLGYTFRPRRTMNRFGKVYQNFSPAMSNKALKAVGQTVRRWKVQLRNDKSIEELAYLYREKIRGWLNYYGKFYPSRLYKLADRIDMALMRWAMRKYKKLKGFSRRAKKRIRQYAEKQPNLFPHWRYSLKQLAR